MEYTVKKGDTLHHIGTRFGVADSELAELNNISDPKRLTVGMVLQIPFVEGVEPQKVNIIRRARGVKDSDGSERASLRRVNIGGVKQYVGALTMPVAGATLTSPFGWRWLKFHEGIDLAAPAGTKIRAAHSGRVVYASERFGGYGKIVVLKGARFLTVYAHNRKNRVSTGDDVARGDWIADVGASGDATGNHVHFETRVHDKEGKYAAVDPMTFIGK